MTQPQFTSQGLVASSPLAEAVEQALRRAVNPEVQLPESIRQMPGMSGQRYRVLVNNLVALTSNARYLEVGSWMGSTLCSAIHGNTVRALAIDNWSQFGGPASAFFSNLAGSVTLQTAVSVLNQDFRQVGYNSIGKFNLYLFDGPHEYQDQYDGLSMALPALDDEFVFIVDDWNWQPVREGTLRAIKDVGLRTLYQVEIRSTLNDIHPAEQGLPSDHYSDWHNGYFIAVLRR